MQSADNTPHENLWDEICVQVQYQISIFLNAYLDTVRVTISQQLRETSEHMKKAFYLQTNKGFDWECYQEDILMLEMVGNRQSI